MTKQTPFIALAAFGLILAGCTHQPMAENATSPYPAEYQSTIDTISPELWPEYFLFDITGDSIPELWITAGTCEADTKLMAYTLTDGHVAKIFDGEGGHSDYFIYDGRLVSVMCSTGSGAVTTYHYDGTRVNESWVEFSTYHPHGQALSEPHDSLTDAILAYWEQPLTDFISPSPCNP